MCLYNAKFTRVATIFITLITYLYLYMSASFQVKLDATIYMLNFKLKIKSTTMHCINNVIEMSK